MMVQEQLEVGSWSEPRTFQKGDVQPMIFSEGDGPPFYSPSLDPNNYVNKPKGIRQVLCERGLLKPDMTLDGKWVDGPGNKPVRDVSTSAHYRLSQCPDFLNQKSALQLQIDTEEHRCDFLPKYHPLLGLGEAVDEDTLQVHIQCTRACWRTCPSPWGTSFL